MLEWFVSSAILLAVLIALHYLLRGKVSPKLQYALWALALVRLLLPFSVGQSYASVENLVPETQHYVLYTAPRTAPAPEASAPSQPQQAAQPPVQVLPAREAAETQKAVRGGSVLDLKTVLTVVWAVGAAGVLLAGADGYRTGTAAYADAGLHTHTGRGAAYNAQMAGAIRAAGLPVRFITPSEYERA